MQYNDISGPLIVQDEWSDVSSVLAGQMIWQVRGSKSKIVKTLYCCDHAGCINKFVAPSSFYDSGYICLLEHGMILLAPTSPVVSSTVRPRSLTPGMSVWCDYQTEPDLIIFIPLPLLFLRPPLFLLFFSLVSLSISLLTPGQLPAHSTGCPVPGSRKSVPHREPPPYFPPPQSLQALLSPVLPLS